MSTIWFYIILLDYKYIFIYRVFRLSAETQLVFLQWIIYYNYVFGLIIYYNIFWNQVTKLDLHPKIQHSIFYQKWV